MLERSQLRVPGAKQSFKLPMCRLDALGAIGPDRKRIHEGFKVTTEDWTPYPAFWGHDSTAVRQLAQKLNAHLSVWTESPRGPDYGPHLWERAGRILLVERLWPVTHRVLALGFNTPIFGNTWWSLKSNILDERLEKCLLLWLNSSLALLLYFGRRVVTRSAWMQMKQPAWESMPVLNVPALTSEQVKMLESTYDAVANLELLPLAQCDKDPVRERIDESLAKVLEIPSLSAIRELLAREPGLTALEINPQEVQSSLDLEDEEAEQAVLL
jgi:hypothetical protein